MKTGLLTILTLTPMLAAFASGWASQTPEGTSSDNQAVSDPFAP